MGLEGLIFGLCLCRPHTKGFSVGEARATQFRATLFLRVLGRRV